MKNILFYVFIILPLFLSDGILAQNGSAPIISNDDKGLEGIIVEPFYIHSKNSPGVKEAGVIKGSITYRIYVDMLPGYKLQAIYGVNNHPLYFKTTTIFFNDKERGARSGKLILDSLIYHPSVAFDSWLTLGAASVSYVGILKEEDFDGSFIRIPFLDKTDGLTAGINPSINLYKIDLSFFQKSDSTCFMVKDGVMSCNDGISGPTSNNRVLIAQLTTNGKLSFNLNLQILNPFGVAERYVALNPAENEILFEELNFRQTKK